MEQDPLEVGRGAVGQPCRLPCPVERDTAPLALFPAIMRPRLSQDTPETNRPWVPGAQVLKRQAHRTPVVKPLPGKVTRQKSLWRRQILLEDSHPCTLPAALHTLGIHTSAGLSLKLAEKSSLEREGETPCLLCERKRSSGKERGKHCPDIRGHVGSAT